MSIALYSKRLKIRPLQMEDTAALFAYRSDAVTNQFQSWIPKSKEEVEAFIRKNPTEVNVPESWFQVALVKQEDGQMIGDIGIHFKGSDNRQVELGCTLDKRFHGQGYASEGLNRVIQYLFEELDKHRIVASIDPQNKPSMQLMERLDFRKEAHFVESLWIKGQWVDDIIYALLQREWKKPS
ncbi:MAG: GNAT family protein [Bacteroidota bacterium]